MLLASASPRRAELLRAAGFSFTIQGMDIDERRLPGEPPDAHVRRLAREKAQAAAAGHPDAVVLGADTTVVAADGALLAKPADDREAAGMLRRLAGRRHTVLTGLAVQLGGRLVEAVEATEVGVLPMSEAEIAWYVATGEGRDKAGGYAIQGLASRFIDRIDGSYSNVVGLPVSTFCRLLREAGAAGLLTARPGSRGA
ncbi:MAG: septum formation protein Maf [Acidobacteriota bacterium]|nr:septum formation protein Maf [Acidobacteriota bacterium]